MSAIVPGVYQFTTSAGIVQFVLKRGQRDKWCSSELEEHWQCSAIADGLATLNKLYVTTTDSSYDPPLWIDDNAPGWVKISLADGYYGSPEYPYTPVN